MSKRLGIGVIGLGRLGSSYARYFTGRITGGTLVAVSDISESVAEPLATELGVGKCYRCYQDLITDKEVEAVVIVSPTSTHKQIVIEAVKEGKPIFCEKPLSILLAEANEMLGGILLTTINLAYYQELMAAMRAAIGAGTFAAFREATCEGWSRGDLAPL